jgi:glycerol-3-phosphate acyltransferase PlsY
MLGSMIIGYLLGNFQTAYIIGKLFGKMDIREKGSANAGASNVTQVMGWRFGLITALVDIFKAFIAVKISFWIFGGELEAFTAGTFTVLGHMFPFYLGFKGGKGLASLTGMMLAFRPEIGIAMMISILLLTIITDYIAVGSLTVYVGLPFILYFYGMDSVIVFEAAALAIVGLWMHIGNIKKIIKKEEKGLRATLKRGK